ncbi:MAG: T9SS type A sorting domain-containing protein [Bacteroidia bacterium]
MQSITNMERNGLYPVTLVARNACGEDTAIRFVNVLNAGIPDPGPLEGLSLFPIPIQNHEFFIQNNGLLLKGMKLRLYTTEGKLLKQWEVKAAQQGWKQRFGIGDLAKGMYFLELSVDGNRKTCPVGD